MLNTVHRKMYLVNISSKIVVGIYLLTVICLLLVSCTQKTLFKKLSSDDTGIKFNNAIVENDSINPINVEYTYNGGGVAVGDFNKDGLPDLYFTASVSSNKLYLNKGNLRFEDVTDSAGVSGRGEWSNAATVIDINNDGYEDIYVCTTIKSDPQQRRNLLYINEGKQTDGVPRFKEMASEYGLADTSYAVHAAFLDYDNDGDLDMYLVTTKIAKRASTSFIIRDTSKMDIDKLYRNDWNAQLNHPVFTDVSKEAGINLHGFGLGIAVTDINKDGWKDIYVTNDFFGSDHFYINNKNGTFTDSIKEYFKHISQNAMGCDIADINNDGLEDVITLDMDPEDNFRKKTNLSNGNYYIYQRMLNDSLELQYVRNTLQLNQGNYYNPIDKTTRPVFAEIGFYAGIEATDWSWSPSVADFNNDGLRDIIITNGYAKDIIKVACHGFVTAINGEKESLRKIVALVV